MSVLMRGIFISTLIQAYMSVLMRHQNKGSHKHATNTSIFERAYETGILISTPIPAIMSVLMRGFLISTPIQAYERDSHKNANTSIYERAYETPK